MCGILGASFTDDSINKEVFKDALDLLLHRGPDSSETWFNDTNNDAFGFKRLSIIDLTQNGDQPLTSSCGNYKIIFNGEIYNFKSLRKILLEKGYIFNSSSDSEVLLTTYIEWGEECLKKIDGMFAFAIYDLINKSIFAARDLAGQKPFYYSLDNGSLIFASEIKPITFLNSASKIIDQNSSYDYFYQGFISRTQSIYKNIHKLPPSHFMTFDLTSREMRVLPYDDLISRASKLNSQSLISDSKQAVSTLDKLLGESVNNSLISDVPLGVLLSGGLDSSLIAAYASRQTKDLKTFTVIFPNHAKYNEQIHARRVADYLKTDHTEINVEKISPELIENLAYFYDEPFSDPSMIPTYILSKAVKKHCSVVLGGDGGDELFGGYPSYTKKMKLKSGIDSIPFPLRNYLSTISQKLLPTNLRGYSYIKNFGDDFNKVFTSFDPLFYPGDIKKLFNKKLLLDDNSNNKDQSLSSIKNFLTRMSIGDYLSFLSEDVLVKVDRASMAHSLEVRSPFLSREIIDFAFLKLHPDLKVKYGTKKIILKLLGESLLPDNFVYNRKQGFSFPLRDLLLEEDWREFFRNKIDDFHSDILNKDFAIKLLDSHGKGQFNERKLFAIIQFICWHKKHANVSSYL